MKAHSIRGLLLLTIVAYGATTIIYDTQHRRYPLSDQNGEQQQNGDSGLLSYSQETVDDRFESSSDVTDSINVTEHENFENTDKIKNNSNYGYSNENYYLNPNNRSNESNNQNNDDSQSSSDSDWSHIASERSSEFFSTTDESGEQHFFENDTITDDGSATVGRSVAATIAALDGIIAEEHRCSENLLDVEDPVPVKKSAVKVTKRNFVSFRNATVRNTKSGRLEYLSIDPANDRVYAECAFDALTADGDFKTNLPRTKAGRFAVDMTDVRGHASASLHRGGRPAAARCAAASRAVAVRVAAEDRGDADAAVAADATVAAAVRRKYRGVLEGAVCGAVHAATRAGVVARLVAELKTPLRADATPWDADDRTAAGDGVGVRVTVRGGRWRAPAGGRMSYARDGRSAYRVRLDAVLGGAPRWTGELAVTADGGRRRAGSAALQLTADGVRVRALVSKSLAGGHGGRGWCRDVQVHVRVHGLRYDLQDPAFPGWAESVVRRALPALVRRSLEAYVKNSIVRDVCRGRIAAADGADPERRP